MLAAGKKDILTVHFFLRVKGVDLTICNDVRNIADPPTVLVFTLV
jgi:hypothetical protein